MKSIEKEGRYLTHQDTKAFIKHGLSSANLAGKRVLALVPDRTRTMPMGLISESLNETIAKIGAELDFLVALGTHPHLDDAELSLLFEAPVRHGQIGNSQVFNHAWDTPGMLKKIGDITAAKMAELTGGHLSTELPIQISRRIFEYDHLLICGPVFPHEVVGFSGGNKYLFPGVSGPDVINLTHWLGALLTSYQVIGSGYTPVRAVIDRAAAMVDMPKTSFSFVLDQSGIYGIYYGSPEETWEHASQLSAQYHIRQVGRSFQKVLAVLPEKYNDMWVGGKGMYKTEPVVVDGGEVIIYAPHITEISRTHGKVIREIGYHVSEYFLKQWDQFKHYPGGVLAHSTHVKGMGHFDAATGTEIPRITVSLATGIEKSVCEALNLGYRDPASIKVDDWVGREDEGILVVENAGEILYRVE